MSIIALCGFRGHGRKTFYKDTLKGMNGVEREYQRFEIKHHTKPILRIKLEQRPKLIKFSSEDKIKYEICDRYNLRYDQLEGLLNNPINQCTHTYSDMVEATLKQRLREDPIYSLSMIKDLSITPETTVMVTDIRSRFELEYLRRLSNSKKYEFMTVRVFRDDVPFPKDHELNQVKTDYFVTNDYNSLKKFETSVGLTESSLVAELCECENNLKIDQIIRRRQR